LKKLLYEVSSVELLEEASENSQFATAKIEVFNTGISRHNTDCDEETLRRTAFTIYEKPVIFEMDYTMGDFGTHSKFTIPAGFVIPNSESFITRPDGRIALVVLAKIWKKYSGKFLQVFKETGSNKKKVSAEIEIYDEVQRGEVRDLKEFAYSAVCVLGDYITEASPDSKIEMLSFAKKEETEYKSAYKKEFSLKYPELDFNIPDEVKEESKKGLDIYNKQRRGGDSVTLSIARYILKNSQITPDKLRTIFKKFSKYDGVDDWDYESDGYISFLLIGGTSGRTWASDLFSKMSDLDKVRKSYFSKDSDNKDGKEKEGKMEDEKDEKEEEVVEQEKPETPATEEEMAVAPPEEQAEKPEEQMSLSGYFDVAAAIEFLEAEGESDPEAAGKISMAVAELKKTEKQDFGVIMAGMYCKGYCMKGRMALMAEEKNVYMAENTSLKEFKMGIESQQKQFAVDSMLNELSEKVVVSDDDMAEMRNKSAEFSLDKIDEWKAYCKAKSFDFAVKPTKDKNKPEIIRAAFVWGATTPTVKDDLWKS